MHGQKKIKFLMLNLRSATLNERQSLNATAPSFCAQSDGQAYIHWRYTKKCIQVSAYTHTICYGILSLINLTWLYNASHTATVLSFINIHSTFSMVLNVCRWLNKLTVEF